jgi:hypothetical protein
MTIKLLKLLDQFATEPKLLIARGSENRGKDYSDRFGSWVGLTLTIFVTGFSLFYLNYLYVEMTTSSNDIYKSFV